MTCFTRRFAVAIGCFFLLLSPAAIGGPPDLAHNPFTRPPSERTVAAPQRRGESDGPIQSLDLRATLVGTRDRLANVGGLILRPGDEIQGYTLLQVYEDRAVFDRQGEQETIYVKPHPVEDDE